jgi:uncharacterized membrane protein
MARASALSLVLLIAAWRASPALPLYDPPLWSRIAGFLLVLLAFMCLGIFLFRAGLRQLVRWPWPLAVMLLALGHLLTLGDLAAWCCSRAFPLWRGLDRGFVGRGCAAVAGMPGRP